MAKPDWQNQSMKKTGGAAPVNRMNAKLTGGVSSSMHSKICAPSSSMGAKMARPVLKMADGGIVDEFGDYDNAVNANSENGEWARGENYGDGTTGDQRVEAARARADASAMKMPSVEDDAEKESDAPAKAMSFKEAFASNRKAGNATFEWNGKKYTTEVAKAAPSKSAATKPAEAPKAATKSSGMSLAPSKGAEYQTMSRIADEAAKNPNASAAAKQAARRNADNARATYEAAADAEKTGRSVVFKR